MCSLENTSIDELRSISNNFGSINRNSISYCQGIAKLFLDNKFIDPVKIYMNRDCGHYSFSDGQHRTCVVARILRKGAIVTLKAEIHELNCICGKCSTKMNLAERESSITWFDRKFKTRKYTELKRDITLDDDHVFIYTFDY